MRELAVQGFGNLTLLTQPLNSSVSNGPFPDSADEASARVLGKRSRLGQSALLMNTWFQQSGLSQWDEDAISTRAQALAKAALLVWPRPFEAGANPVAVAAALNGTST